jgi:hypothetical protein
MSSAISLRSMRRQRELKRGTVGCVYRGPQPATMGFYDRTADRESHIHAAGFGGEKGVEGLFRIKIFVEEECACGVIDKSGDFR